MSTEIAKGGRGIFDGVAYEQPGPPDDFPDEWVIQYLPTSEQVASWDDLNGWGCSVSNIREEYSGSGVYNLADFQVSVPLTAEYGGYGVRYLKQNYKNSSYNYDGTFEVTCMTVEVTTQKISSSPVPGSNPVQYTHLFSAHAEVEGGTAPFTYSWSFTVGTLYGYSADGTTVLIQVTDSNPNGGTVSGTVTCNVEDERWLLRQR